MNENNDDVFIFEIYPTLLSDTITSIKFSELFNQRIANLPTDLKYLEFGHLYNQPLPNLPHGLKRLTFGQLYNQPLIFDNSTLPSSLTHLKFGCEFNQPLPNLPYNLTHLTLGYEFTHPIILPPNLIHLDIKYTYPYKTDILNKFAINKHNLMKRRISLFDELVIKKNTSCWLL